MVGSVRLIARRAGCRLRGVATNGAERWTVSRPLNSKDRSPTWPACDCGGTHAGVAPHCWRCDMTRPRSVLGAPSGSSAMAATTDRRARPWPHEGTLRGLSVILAFALLVAAAAAAVTSVRDALGRNGQPEAEVSDGRLWSQDPVVRRLAGYVERARGLRFLRSVPVVRMDGATLRARMSSGSLLDLADAQRPTATLRALGLITSRSAVAPSGSLGDAVGYYDITSKQVYVRKDLTPHLLGFVLVHELTHALQDQHFDLSRTYGDNADAALAAISLVEGDAERLARSYLETLTPSAIDEVQREAPTQPDELYRGIYHESADEFPYVAGEAFARALLEHGGQAQLDAAFGSYP